MYEIFEHTADLGIRVRAAELDDLFAEAAQALFSVIVRNTERIESRVEKRFQIEGPEIDYLLFDWLNELLYTFDVERLLLNDFQVRVQESGLSAVCRGEKMDRRRHVMDHEVKAITYHGLKVERGDQGWLAEVIVDI